MSKTKTLKENNNLIRLTINNDEMQYFTSGTKAAAYIGDTTAGLVLYNMARQKTMVDSDGNVYAIELVDGTRIPYSMINNIRK